MIWVAVLSILDALSDTGFDPDTLLELPSQSYLFWMRSLTQDYEMRALIDCRSPIYSGCAL